MHAFILSRQQQQRYRQESFHIAQITVTTAIAKAKTAYMTTLCSSASTVRKQCIVSHPRSCSYRSAGSGVTCHPASQENMDDAEERMPTTT